MEEQNLPPEAEPSLGEPQDIIPEAADDAIAEAAAEEPIEVPPVQVEVLAENEEAPPDSRAEILQDAAPAEETANDEITPAETAEVAPAAAEEVEESQLEELADEERVTSADADAAGPLEPELELTPLEATTAFREKYIESCSMYGCDPVPLLLQVIDASLEQGEPLTAVVLNGNSKYLFNKRLNLKQVHALANALQSSNVITELHLCYNFLDDKAAQAVAELLKVNRTLATVALDGNEIGPEGAKYLADSLAAQTSEDAGLTSLKLSLNPLEDKGGLYVAEMLRTNRRLKHLFISGTHMGMPSVVAVAAALQESNTTLEILDISNNHAVSCHDEPAIAFSKVLARHPSLWALSLSRWRMNDYGLENLITVSHAALENQTLRYLDLSCNRLTEVSGKFIARLIAANTPLETLRLGCNELHDNAAYEIANSLMDNETLVELDLSFNGLTDGALQELAQGKREEIDYPLHCDFKVYVVDGVSQVAKVTEE